MGSFRANIVFVLILVLSSLGTLCNASANAHQQSMQDLMLRACTNIENQNLCLSNIHSELQKLGPSDPHAVLHAAIKNSLKQAQHSIQLISQFTPLSFTYREQIAIQDCQELLDFSVSELSWSLDTMREIRAGSTTPYYEGDLQTWLSAALSNQDTCLQGFEGTNRQVANFIRGSLQQVTQLVNNVLSLYTDLHTLPFKPSRNNTRVHTSEFPYWMTDGDQELLKASPHGMRVDAIVAQDGSGHFTSITEAVDEAPSHSDRRYVIYIKKGTYRENINLKKKTTNIMFVGDGIGATVVTSNRNFMQGWTTFRTATVAVSGKGFIARDMTFRNTAGPQNHQAVALRVDSDQSAFFRCSVEGFQDTLYAHSLRQFYRECNIYGTIDFIFGNGAAVLQNCRIYTRVPMPLQKVTITAQGRKSPQQNTGFSIQDSHIMAAHPTYLGRPWKQYSRTVYMNTYMSNQVQPRGWLEWFGNFALNTLWYGEYKNYGPGANLAGRVKWPGYHIIKDPAVANSFTPGQFIDGMSWLPGTGVKFTAGLSN